MRPLVVIAVVVLVLSLLVLFGPERVDRPKLARASGVEAPIYERVCQQCHGVRGAGSAELRTPSIAGQPAWYLEEQLGKFRSGWRGAEPRDVAGQQMRSIALALSETELDEVVRVVAAFPRHETEPVLAGDLPLGRLVYEEQCIDCHRYNGSGEKVFGSSPLSGFQDWYIAAQLEKFRLGIRGYHADDERGAQMRHLISYLDETELNDVAAYIATLGERYPPRDRRR